MATFKVNDRVRVKMVEPNQGADHVLGLEGTITARRPAFITHGCIWAVAIDGVTCGARDDGCFVFDDCHLAPLTDPAADAFLESVKSWKPEPVAPPLPVKEKSRA